MSIIPMELLLSLGFAATSGSRPGNRHICSHCGAPGHTKDQCFKLHPKFREKILIAKGNPSLVLLRLPRLLLAMLLMASLRFSLKSINSKLN